MIKDKRILLLFSGIVVLFSYVTLQHGNEINEYIFSMMMVVPLAIASYLSFYLSRKYKKVPKFCLGHILLGLSMAFYVMAEVSWIVFGEFGMDQYPSFVDVLYTLYMLFALLHPISILRFFGARLKKIHYGIISGTVIITLIIYTLYAEPLEGIETWLMGFHFVGIASTTLGVILVTTILLKNRQVFPFWVLIGIAFVVNILSDLHYYSAENWSDWQQSDWVNVLWFTSTMIIIYALLQHRRMYHVLKS